MATIDRNEARRQGYATGERAYRAAMRGYRWYKANHHRAGKIKPPMHIAMKLKLIEVEKTE
jgi:hypothetical protein